MRLYLFLMLGLSGCIIDTRSPETHFYLLDPVLDQTLIIEQPQLVIGIGPVELASHLDKSQLIWRDGVKLYQEEYQRWAGDLADNIGQVMADNLSQATGIESIWTYPYPPYLPIKYQIQFHISRFEWDRAQQKVIIAGQWHWVDMNQRQSLLIKRFNIEQEVVSENPEEQIAALNQALARLGQQIITSIQAQLNADAQ